MNNFKESINRSDFNIDGFVQSYFEADLIENDVLDVFHELQGALSTLEFLQLIDLDFSSSTLKRFKEDFLL